MWSRRRDKSILSDTEIRKICFFIFIMYKLAIEMPNTLYLKIVNEDQVPHIINSNTKFYLSWLDRFSDICLRLNMDKGRFPIFLSVKLEI